MGWSARWPNHISVEIFGKHVKRSYQLPQEYDHADDRWAINRMVNEAINLTQEEPPGPVHINAPFREPLYPGVEENLIFGDEIRVIEEHATTFELDENQKKSIIEAWPSYHNVLLVAGQQDYDTALFTALSSVSFNVTTPL